MTLFWRVQPPKIEDKQVPGIYVYWFFWCPGSWKKQWSNNSELILTSEIWIVSINSTYHKKFLNVLIYLGQLDKWPTFGRDSLTVRHHLWCVFGPRSLYFAQISHESHPSKQPHPHLMVDHHHHHVHHHHQHQRNHHHHLHHHRYDVDLRGGRSSHRGHGTSWVYLRGGWNYQAMLKNMHKSHFGSFPQGSEGT